MGAGGNVGAVAAGFLLKAVGDVPKCFEILGLAALLSSAFAIAIRFSASHKARETEAYEQARAASRAMVVAEPVG